MKQRRPHHQVFAALLGMALGLAVLALPNTVHPTVRWVYNASDSAPRGWYRVAPALSLHTGDMVIARLPRDAMNLAASRGYLPQRVPVLKRIAAMSGQRVCVQQGVVTVDGNAVTRVLARDFKDRALDAWKGCRDLVGGELFLLNTGHPASFDSRYFGPIDASFVIGTATRAHLGNEP